MLENPGHLLMIFSDGLSLLFSIAVDNSRKLDEVWQEMHMLNKNKKTSKSGDVA